MRPRGHPLADADRPWPKGQGAGYLIAWPVMPLAGVPGVIRRPVGFELTLGTVGRHGQERLRPSLPRDAAEGVRRLRFVLRATQALEGFLILPWAVRSHEDAGVLEEAWRQVDPPRERETYVVPLRPAGFVAETSQSVLQRGFRRAAEGEPYLHRSAVQRLGLTDRDFVLLAPMPDRLPLHWAQDVADLGLGGRVPTVGRDVMDRDVLRVLMEAGVTYATGRSLAHPVAVPLPWARREPSRAGVGSTELDGTAMHPGPDPGER